VSEVHYKVDNAYDRTREGGLRWSDPDLGIPWPLAGQPILSPKDREALSLQEFIAKHGALGVSGPS
jgi:dTDP-4-dehydrorhamnose 3,5-epimerase